MQLSDQNLYDTITGGLGVMPAFKRFITSEDRRAIVAYIRVLQREGHAK
jgi:mono/diheme cytochrome c family protein